MTGNEELMELQVKVAFQEETIDALNTVLTRQQNQLDRLQQELQMLRDRYEQLATEQSAPVAESVSEKPPHY